jgi:3-oxoacyl-[acyl-carrier protein] reductase
MGTAVVTGAGQGLGRAIAIRLSADGYDVVALDINLDGARETAEMVAGRAVRCDVGDRSEVTSVARSLGPIEVLVNNAGIWRVESLLTAPEGDVEDVLRVNLLGTVSCCMAFAPSFAEGGSIINVSSAAATTHSPEVGIYPAAKGAIEVVTMQLAAELGPLGIRVNAIAPGFIKTEGTAANYEGERGAKRLRSVPLRRAGEGRDISNVVSFLASEQSSYVSGQIIAVDGGLVAARPSG